MIRMTMVPHRLESPKITNLMIELLSPPQKEIQLLAVVGTCMGACIVGLCPVVAFVIGSSINCKNDVAL